LANLIMKTITKRIRHLVLFLALAAGFLGINAVFAANAARPVVSTSTPKTTSAGKLYCDKVVSLLSEIGQKLGDFNTKLQQIRTQTASKIKESRQKRDQELKSVRDKWAANRQEQFKALEGKAQTDAQKQAVAKFKSAVLSAITTRQQAVDAAIKAYRNGLDKIISDRKLAIDAAKTALRNSVKAAADKAKADCDAGVDFQTARQNLQASLKAAREKYTADIQALEKNRQQTMQQLVAARQEAVKKAVDDFLATMEKLRVELKAAFGENFGQATTTPQQSF